MYTHNNTLYIMIHGCCLCSCYVYKQNNRKNNKAQEKYLPMQTSIHKKRALWHTFFILETRSYDVYLSFHRIKFHCATCDPIGNHACLIIHNACVKFNGNHRIWYPESTIRSPLTRKLHEHFEMPGECSMRLHDVKLWSNQVHWTSWWQFLNRYVFRGSETTIKRCNIILS